MTGASAKSLLLQAPRLVLLDREIQPGSILIENGRIVEISTGDLAGGAGVEGKVDLSGTTIFPGFIDFHIHGAVGVDTMAATAADLDRVSQFLATRGITGWLPTLVPAPVTDYASAISSIDEATRSTGRARILGVHYEGPFVNSAQCGALHAEFFRSFSGVSDLDDLPKLSDQRAKHMITLAPEIVGGV